MKNLFNPRWIIALTILPSILLLFLLYGQFTIIRNLMDTDNVAIWKEYAVWLIVLTTFQMVYAGICMAKKAPISAYHAILNLVFYSAFLYALVDNESSFIPFSVPNWMINIDPLYYSGTFLMPSLIHALFILVVKSSKKSTASSPWLSFLYSLFIPILVYVFVQINLPLWQGINSNFEQHAFVVLVISASIFFLFFISRGFYLLTIRRSGILVKYEIILKVIFCLILPFLGLLINNGVFSPQYGFGSNVFGDFSSLWFYILTVLNALILCLSPIQSKRFRLIRFIALLACYPFTLYFFLVFLPFLPLALPAVIFIGFGFLLLAPLVLFIIQTNCFYQEYQVLKQFYPTTRLIFLGCSAFLILPTTITVCNLHDKYTLNNALEYVYSRDYTKKYHINSQSLLKTLDKIQRNKSHRNELGNQHQPFLSPYFNWLVLDNLALSDKKIRKLAAIFDGTYEENTVLEPPFPHDVKMAKITANSMFDSSQNAWRSTIDFELRNDSKIDLNSFETVFNLPAGCWVSNYYLYVGKRKEYGILAEKKSALWVFSNIRNERRDPGILYYLTGNKIAFKIFPFAAKETRKSGIELLHKEPFTFKIDGKSVVLGNMTKNSSAKIASINGSNYIPANQKKNLPLVKRSAKYHFIVNVSSGKESHIDSYIQRITQFVAQKKINPSQIEIDFTNATMDSIAYTLNWKKRLSEQTFQGGFYAEGAIKEILTDRMSKHDNSFPVIILVSNDSKIELLPDDFADYKMAFPESDLFYELDTENNLWSHSLVEHAKLRKENVRAISALPVRVWKTKTAESFYLPDDNQASFLFNKNEFKNDNLSNKTTKWITGLHLQGVWTNVLFYKSASEEQHLSLIRQSMQSGILSPFTSYLVVENEAQKIALMKKQKQILSGNKNLDPDEDTQRMDEPNLSLLLAALLLFIGYRNKGKLRTYYRLKFTSKRKKLSVFFG
ncbi:MSEP-CTERM sorting domain-containing protein [Pedobacter sp. MW01-1-1]|uniref:MSEP-CTERM sorting domain-containing protein n=1 Tax=Pedobacter sp. MW01-1-1 TaxID=3383027 RepID=UPI003FEF8A47